MCNRKPEYYVSIKSLKNTNKMMNMEYLRQSMANNRNMKLCDFLKTLPTYLLNLIRIIFMTLLLRPKKRHDLERLGSGCGGYYIPTTLLDSDSICYCIGVGDDISFDLDLISRFNCEIYAFDPTPRSIEYVKDNASNISRYHFFNVGLWSSDTMLRFYAPKNPEHVSHSILNLQHSSDFFVARCRRLIQIMNEFSHDHLELIKLNIEGAEYEVLESILEDNLDISIICVTFDQPMPLRKTRRAIDSLCNHGYDLVNIDHWNYTFIKSSQN
jgi:FkbM family methyltransferase